MKPGKPRTIAEKEAEARKNSVLLNYSYFNTPFALRSGAPPTCFKGVRPELGQMLMELTATAIKYHELTGRHLPIFGELGELFVEVVFGLKRHGPMTRGSDGKLGNDFVEVKTITPDKHNDTVQVKRAGNFSKLVVVKITNDFQFGARMVSRRILKKGEGKFAKLSWDKMTAGEPDQKPHKSFPFGPVPRKGATL